MIKQKFLILFLLVGLVQVFLISISLIPFSFILAQELGGPGYCPTCENEAYMLSGYDSYGDCAAALCGVGEAGPDVSPNPGGSSGGVAGKLDNPLGNKNIDPRVIVGNIIKAALGIAGSLALAVFILGGLTWVVSAGSEEKVTRGKNMIMWAAFGLGVIFTSYALVNFVIKALTGT